MPVQAHSHSGNTNVQVSAPSNIANKLPSEPAGSTVDEKISNTLEKVENTAETIKHQNLPPTTQKIVGDVERAAAATKHLIDEKFEGGKLDSVLEHSKSAGQKAGQAGQSLVQSTNVNIHAPNVKLPSGPDTQGIVSDLRESLHEFVTLAKLVTTSPDFRYLLSELTSLLHDLTADAAEKAGQIAQNAAQKAGDVAQRAAQQAGDVAQQAANKASQVADRVADRAPELAQKAGQAAENVASGKTQPSLGSAQASAANVKNQAQSAVDSARTKAQSSIDSAKSQAQSTIESAKSQAQPQIDQAKGAARNATEQAKAGAQNVAEQAKSTAQDVAKSSNISASNIKDKSPREIAAAVSSGVSGASATLQAKAGEIGETLKEKIPAEQREQILQRIRNIAATAQNRPEYQHAVDTLVNLAHRLYEQAKSAAIETSQQVKQAAVELKDQVKQQAKEVKGQVQDKAGNLQASNADNDAKIAARDAKTIVENFAGGRSLDTLAKDIKNFAILIKDDQRLRDLIRDCVNFLKQTLKEKQFLEQSGYADKLNNYYTDLYNSLQSQKYKAAAHEITHEANTYVNCLVNDPTTQEVIASFSQLARDTFLDEDGNFVIRTELLEDMRRALPGVLRETLKNVPVPRVDIDDPSMTASFDNVLLEAENILPDYFQLDTTTIYEEKKNAQDKVKVMVRFKLSQMQVGAKNIEFTYHKKTFPQMSDKGLADFQITGKGMSIELLLTPDTRSTTRTFKVYRASCVIDNINIKIHDAKHEFLYTIFKPILKTIAKKNIEKTVEDKLRQFVLNLDETVTRNAVAATDAVSTAANAAKQASLPNVGSKIASALGQGGHTDKNVSGPKTNLQSQIPNQVGADNTRVPMKSGNERAM